VVEVIGLHGRDAECRGCPVGAQPAQVRDVVLHVEQHAGDDLVARRIVGDVRSTVSVMGSAALQLHVPLA
jgi:hypothetical protein